MTVAEPDVPVGDANDERRAFSSSFARRLGGNLAAAFSRVRALMPANPPATPFGTLTLGCSASGKLIVGSEGFICSRCDSWLDAGCSLFMASECRQREGVARSPYLLLLTGPTCLALGQA